MENTDKQAYWTGVIKSWKENDISFSSLGYWRKDPAHSAYFAVGANTAGTPGNLPYAKHPLDAWKTVKRFVRSVFANDGSRIFC